MQAVYFTAERSATTSGYVGLVIDPETHHALLRTPLTYTTEAEARLAARNMWLSRPRVINNAQEVA